MENKTKADVAFEYFADNYNCSQAVFTAYGTDMGLTEDQCLKIACPYGAGMARQQYTCGAVTGALMVIGLKYGKGVDNDNNKRLLTYDKTVEFMNKFKQQHGSTICKELLNGLDMSNPDDVKKIDELNLFEVKCAGYVKNATSILDKLL